VVDIWSSWVWPLATAALGFVYVALLLSQYSKRRRPHQLMWTIGFLFYAVAAVMEAVSEYTQHWDPTVYRVYIVLAACLVGFLGNGTLYLITRKRLWGNLYLLFNLACVAVFLWGTFHAQLDVARLIPGITVGGQALGPASSFPRIMSLVFNIPGSLLLLGGSAWSIAKFWPRKEYRYRVWANVLIFVGALLIAGAGSMARIGTTVGLYPAEMFASAVLLAGFLMASTLERGARAVHAEHVEAVGDDDAPEVPPAE
jgi:multisubunit Na+/H+ antiporter MnhE subunit